MSSAPLPPPDEASLRAQLGAGEEAPAARCERPLRIALGGAGDALHEVLSGRVRVGEELLVSPGHRQATVAGITTPDGRRCAGASAGETVRLILRPAFALERGQIASHELFAPLESNRCHARLLWEGPAGLVPGERLWLTLAGQRVEAELVAPVAGLAPGACGEVTLRFYGALAMDNFEQNPILARFALASEDGGHGRGLVCGGLYPGRTHVKSTNLTWTEGDLTPRHRALRNGHRGAVLWLTGLSGSGKSTLSRALERRLFALGMHVYVLDGDNVRRGLNANLGFSPADREENIRRVAEVAKLLSHAGFIAITAFISPYRLDRRRAREIALEAGGEFIEVFVDAPLAVCEQRDVKGLYKKARAGEIRDFTGISAPYEHPLEPEVTVQTDRQTLEESTEKVIDYLARRLRGETDDYTI